jgi:hypothetical protein
MGRCIIWMGRCHINALYGREDALYGTTMTLEQNLGFVTGICK